MDTQELTQRGLELRCKIFGAAAVESRMNAFGEFGAPLQNLINGVAYGDVWSRGGISNQMRSLAMLGITAALNRPRELRVHALGALATGCTAEEMREILLLVAVYCGSPAANDAHRVVYEVLQENAAV